MSPPTDDELARIYSEAARACDEGEYYAGHALCCDRAGVRADERSRLAVAYETASDEHLQGILAQQPERQPGGPSAEYIKGWEAATVWAIEFILTADIARGDTP